MVITIKVNWKKLKFYKNVLENINLEFFLISLLIPFFKFRLGLSNYVDIFYIAYFFNILREKRNYREPIFGALILLIITSLLLILKKGTFANVVVIGVYYLLVVGVLAQLVEFLRRNRKNEKAKNR